MFGFANFAEADIPRSAAGCYTVWRGQQFIYVGMAGRAAKAEDLARHDQSRGAPKGLAQRLLSHGSGRRSGDQFCIYVADRFVLPSLSRPQVEDIAAATVKLDALTRDFIQAELRFRWCATSSGAEALALERLIQREGLPGAGRPLLNPLPSQTEKP